MNELDFLSRRFIKLKPFRFRLEMKLNIILSFFKVRIMYEDFIKGTKDNSENSTYTGFQKYFETKIGIK